MHPKLKFVLPVLASLVVGLLIGLSLPYYPPIQKFIGNIYHSLPSFSLGEEEHGERVITLNVRTFKGAGDPEAYDTEADSTYNYGARKLDLNEVALVLIDVWQDHPNDGWGGREITNIKTKIVPLLELVRKTNIKIVHAPHNRRIHPLAKPLQGEFVVDSHNLIDDTLELDRYLKAHNIKILLYAGYASNMCVLFRPTGIIKMKERGYDIILIRDCTIAFETPESLNGEWANRMAINMVESSLGQTTTLEELRASINAKDGE